MRWYIRLGAVLWAAFCGLAAAFAFTLDLSLMNQMAAAAFPLLAGAILPAIIMSKGDR